MSAPTDQVRRLLAMVPFLTAHPGIEVAAAAHTLGIPEAQLLADLDRLLMCGVPPYYPHDYVGVDVEGGRIHLFFAEHLARPVRLSVEEAVAVWALLTQAAPPLTFESEDLPAVLSGIKYKLGALLPPDEQEAFDQIDARVRSAREPEELARLLATIRAAIAQRRVLRLSYYTASRDELRDREVHPQDCRRHQGELYLRAFCLARQAPRAFRIDRIRAAMPLETTFAAPVPNREDDFRPAAAAFESGGDPVRVRFEPEAARWVGERWPAERLESLNDGGVRLCLDPPDPRFLVRLLLPFGAQAVVESPPSLRQAMHDALLALSKAHEDGP